MSDLPELTLLLPDGEYPSWQDDALCAQIGGDETWFPDKGGSPRAAKRMCARCDVRPECLETALANREEYGVYGGTTAAERKRIVKKRGEVWRQAYRGEEEECAS